jgi:hypothetical protein
MYVGNTSPRAVSETSAGNDHWRLTGAAVASALGAGAGVEVRAGDAMRPGVDVIGVGVADGGSLGGGGSSVP